MSAQPTHTWSRTYCADHHWVPVVGCDWCPSEKARLSLAKAAHPAGSKRHLAPVPTWEQQRTEGQASARALGAVIGWAVFAALLLIAFAEATPAGVDIACGLIALPLAIKLPFPSRKAKP